MGLTVSDLCCQRSGRPVLDALGFAVAPGEALLLRGPNGAGKSTLLRVLAGLLAPSAGAIELDGAALLRDPDRYGERIAYTGHLDAIKPQLSVAENLAFWSALYGGVGGADGGGDGIAAALAGFDLASIADQPAHVCSAGQKRRLGLARLLVARRSLWLLDEPTVSLDADAVARFCAVVRDHRAHGGLALIATHVALDLGPTRELVLQPLPRTPASDAADPFLSGRWA